jgi:CHAT domain-containing protein
MAESVEADSILVIDDPQPVSSGYLLNSWYESSAAINGVPRHLRLRHEKATVEAVGAVITQYSTFHFSCHGLTDFREPLNSRLILAHNQPFTMRDILESQLPTTRLAVLSACESAIPGVELLDEVISLPTGLLQAGVAGVIGSLWAVFEPSTMELMVRFYNSWREGKSIPEALCRAQQQVRDTTVAEKRKYLSERLEFFADSWTTLPDDTRVYAHQNYWAAFTHVGV